MQIELFVVFVFSVVNNPPFNQLRRYHHVHGVMEYWSDGVILFEILGVRFYLCTSSHIGNSQSAITSLNFIPL
jgi:hypothetical protein